MIWQILTSEISLKFLRNARLHLKPKGCCVVCCLLSALECQTGQSLSLSSEMPVPVCKSSHCQDSLPWDMVFNDAFGQRFHWWKFPLGYSDYIKCGLDVQFKLKPQNGGKGDGYVIPDGFIEFPWEMILHHQLHLLWCLLPANTGWNQITYFRLAIPLGSLYLSPFLWPKKAEIYPIYPFHGLLGQGWKWTQWTWNFSLEMKHLFLHSSSLFAAVTQPSVQGRPCRPQRLVCHPSGSQPQTAWVLGAGLALGFRWLTRLSPLGIWGILSNIPHLKEEGSPWLTSSILLGLKQKRLSQSFIHILSETQNLTEVVPNFFSSAVLLQVPSLHSL